MSKPTRRLKAQPLEGGERFGRLVALEFTGLDKLGTRYWRFRCDCGRVVTTRVSSVISQGVQSCGCLRMERARAASRRHGGTVDYPAEARCWRQMLIRCSNPDHKSYPRYGGRGITVCERWTNFADFIADMGPRPSPEHSIDRLDNDKGYEPENCRWATRTEQQRNRSGNRFVNYQGRRMTVAEASSLGGISQELAKMRLDKGESEAIAFRPARPYRKST